MKITPLVLSLMVACALPSQADVSIKELDDRIRVEIGGELFTEWQHKAWKAPYLYPVIGPNGENVTRHYPMKDGVEGESQDHPHHRSIRFSHRDVNGFSFWAPTSREGANRAEIKLAEVEKMESGKTGELVFWNDWIGDGEVLLREKVRLTFIPLEKRQVLMDYDVELHAKTDVKFGDQKDGGLGIRVAATMKAAKGGKGTIQNSNGLKNEESWGKQAEWCDFYGPDASGKTVGVAIFDHPSNLRHPTHWHARTYGLLTANRFGTGYFAAKEGAERGDGDYTIKKGEKILLKHRLFFHHGDSSVGKVAEKYAAYSKEK